MADSVPSQARFVGWLAAALIVVALLFALVIGIAGNFAA